MVSDDLQNEIRAFISEVGEPLGVDVEDPIPSAVTARVQSYYLPLALAHDESVKREVLQELRAAWRENPNHGNRRRFGRAASNLAEYCLKPTDMRELNATALPHAIDVVVRISGWYHTDSNLWLRFQPYARRVVQLLWGEIEYW